MDDHELNVEIRNRHKLRGKARDIAAFGAYMRREIVRIPESPAWSESTRV